MKALISTTVIHVTNLDNAIKYYTDTLGFHIDFTFGDYAGLVYHQVAIHLNGPGNHGIKKLPGNAHVCIDCDEVDDYYHQILKNGALISVPVADRVYGVRDFAVDDPDGNTLVFGKGIA